MLFGIGQCREAAVTFCLGRLQQVSLLRGWGWAVCLQSFVCERGIFTENKPNPTLELVVFGFEIRWPR
jgi:hypothetical protein